jgi:hypothetical protein
VAASLCVQVEVDGGRACQDVDGCRGRGVVEAAGCAWGH